MVTKKSGAGVMRKCDAGSVKPRDLGIGGCFPCGVVHIKGHAPPQFAVLRHSALLHHSLRRETIATYSIQRSLSPGERAVRSRNCKKSSLSEVSEHLKLVFYEIPREKLENLVAWIIVIAVDSSTTITFLVFGKYYVSITRTLPNTVSVQSSNIDDKCLLRDISGDTGESRSVNRRHCGRHSSAANV
ncbi:hypothetical protein CEXT_45851 [Caerostris extrusa]|uniref:Uncharacterized protein n=1 Tax=Caerostris extrusa TaxID=172846 RepID=A0AAV4XHB2_CAEEX|nr:hypothetical protein CEXT_45851 [Caerostris extrusa]